jgi:hypothetical protein
MSSKTIDLTLQLDGDQLSSSLEITYCVILALTMQLKMRHTITVLECPLYNSIKEKFQTSSLLQNVELGTFKSFYPLDYQG